MGEQQQRVSENWRDEEWVLVSYDPTFWTSPPRKPTPQAELCGEGYWASVFDDRRIVATWVRA